MIAASEARHNVDVFNVSGKKIDEILTLADQIVIKASETGACRADLHVPDLSDAEKERLCKVLKDLGYKVFTTGLTHLTLYWDRSLKD